MINKLPPLNRGYNRDPNITAPKRRGFINHGFTLQAAKIVGPRVEGSVYRPQSFRVSDLKVYRV